MLIAFVAGCVVGVAGIAVASVIGYQPFESEKFLVLDYYRIRELEQANEKLTMDLAESRYLHENQMNNAYDLLQERDRLRETLTEIDHALQVPAAEYVPCIGEVFKIIDAALRREGK